jgi:hypothetical protein
MINVDFDESGDLPHVYLLHTSAGASPREIRANERLMGAAPELLTALVCLVWNPTKSVDLAKSMDVPLTAILAARKAIAQACGYSNAKNSSADF